MSGARDNGTYGICDQQKPKEQLTARRHEANWPDNEGNQTYNIRIRSSELLTAEAKYCICYKMIINL